MSFELVPGLAKKDHIADLRLCTVLFEDNAYYPWIFLVPQKENVKNMMDLTMDERLQLMREMALAEKVMAGLFKYDQTNVAMIGNKTPQLHVHILCRTEGDPDWPTTVWNNASKKYEEAEKKQIIARIREAIEQEKQKPEYNQL
ncbi:MAG: HIT family protein [Proteobacteria bacterium]|nr:HIT family protein [Pseudomonadota bacterium]